ncbi:MAG: dihydropteroate synthase [Candidatus Eremiobacteraeota bacterium]|nr:dihydropteroate synthase [Candidatus Eremiobacteraeota bacterium]
MSSNAPVAEGRPRGALSVRGRDLVWGARTYLMGIVNATPDSFSGDGEPDAVKAVARGRSLLEQGADLIDVGAESTRPGHVPIDPLEEVRRIVPVVAGLRAAAPDAIVSIDTHKLAVFAAAHAAGGDILNSICGLDDALLAAAAGCGVPVVVMHNKRGATCRGDVVDEVLRYLSRQAERAVRAGIASERVILDPGIGFEKSSDDNLALLGSLERLAALGFPTLLGTSRKSTLGKLTGRPVNERTYGTAATVALAIAAKIDVVRVHDVAEMRDAARVADAVVRGWRPLDWGAVR